MSQLAKELAVKEVELEKAFERSQDSTISNLHMVQQVKVKPFVLLYIIHCALSLHCIDSLRVGTVN